jgi:hypothetical protein
MKRQAEDMVQTVKLVNHHDAILQTLRSHAEPVVAAPAAAEFRKVQLDPNDPDKGVRFDEGLQLVNRMLSAQAQEASIPAAEQPGRKRVSAASIRRTQELAEVMRRSAELKERPPDEQERIKRLLTTAVEQPDLSELGPVERGWLREGLMPIDAERTFVVKAESARGAVLRQLEDQGQTGSQEYRALSSMQFRALNERSAKDAIQVAHTYLRAAAACTCAAYNPPCATCTDGCVELAKVTVDGCDVVDVCEVHRHWVLSPRAVGYWFPYVEDHMEELERRCCGWDRKQDQAEGDDVRQQTPVAMMRRSATRLEENLRIVGGDEETLRAMVNLQRQLDLVTRRLDKLDEGKEVPEEGREVPA